MLLTYRVGVRASVPWAIAGIGVSSPRRVVGRIIERRVGRRRICWNRCCHGPSMVECADRIESSSSCVSAGFCERGPWDLQALERFESSTLYSISDSISTGPDGAAGTRTHVCVHHIRTEDAVVLSRSPFTSPFASQPVDHLAPITLLANYVWLPRSLAIAAGRTLRYPALLQQHRLPVSE